MKYYAKTGNMIDFFYFHSTLMAFRLLQITLITLAVVSIPVNNTASAYSSNFTDQQALLSVKSLITGDPLGVLSSWNHSIHFCQWKGVSCSRRHDRVTELDLSSLKLEGTLSPHIGNLTFLRLINFTDNSFHGYIPNEIGRLVRLRYLHLAMNSFRGDFPHNLSHCVDIRTIKLSHNNLQGKLPTNFASWSKLNVLILQNNHFSGSIPPIIGNLSSLYILDLGLNNLEGSIPFEVGKLLKLELLQLAVNNLTGMVPLPLYNISSITTFSLARNQLTGRLPPDLGFTLPNLQRFIVSFNKFSGLFPPSIANASNLVSFVIVVNNISGPIPVNLGTLHSLEILNLGTNPLGHRGDLSFFNSLVNCTGLISLGVYENGLSGLLPNSIVNLSTTLQILDMSVNYLHGSIPQEIGKLVNLAYLILANNSLTGSIPKSIGQLSMLGQLYLFGNNISGEIPASISNITGLLILDMSNNMLQGSIPTALFNMSNLLDLDLSVNRLTGVIPEQLGGLSSLSTGLYLQQNLLIGPLPSNIGSLKHVVLLIVSDNQLTGEIPDTLGDCLMLEELYMDGNFFEGRIPSSLKALKSLVSLDLSRNNISGNIPSFIGGFHLMQELNLSHNKLEGEVPKEGVFSNISAFSVVGNLQLCGGIQALRLPACPVKITRKKKKHFRFHKIHLLVLLPIAILLACFVLFFCRLRKSKLKNLPVSVLEDNKHPKLSYQDLLLATDEFSSTNFLGMGRYGSVFRGTLEPVQQIVAVKVFNVEVTGANKSFLAECETLRNIRHRNLIKIITACSSTDFKGNDFKALVFEFMTNGSLNNWLHPNPPDKGKERNLTLLQRLNVAIDVASALDYLHHHSHTRIIHCDIKPSNILLDEEFVARVGDFGLARFVVANTNDITQPHTSSTAIRGTVGYVPPEYGMGGEISANGDVYSYGILLLEIFSGKRPTDSSISLENANNIHDYVKKALPHSVMDITDPRILPELKDGGLIANQYFSRGATEVCLATIFEVGMLCSLETPHERIDINVALKKLHAARDILLRDGH